MPEYSLPPRFSGATELPRSAGARVVDAVDATADGCAVRLVVVPTLGSVVDLGAVLERVNRFAIGVAMGVR